MDIKVNQTPETQFQEVNKPDKTDNPDEFNFTLNKVNDDHLMEKLHSMIDDIAAQGKKLSEHMDVRDLMTYKNMVKDFMNEVVTNSHEFSRENFLDRRGRHRVYGIVKLVDKNLDELAQEVLKNEKDHIKILDKTDEIRGLLLDILI